MIADPIDLELWNEYFRAAIAGSSVSFTDGGVSERAARIADEALEEYQERMKEVSSK